MIELSSALSSDISALLVPFAAVIKFLEPFGNIAAAAAKLIPLLPK